MTAQRRPAPANRCRALAPSGLWAGALALLPASTTLRPEDRGASVAGWIAALPADPGRADRPVLATLAPWNPSPPRPSRPLPRRPSVDEVQWVLGRIEPQVQTCGAVGPRMVVVHVVFAGDGTVASAAAADVPPEVAACVEAWVRRARILGMSNTEPMVVDYAYRIP